MSNVISNRIFNKSLSLDLYNEGVVFEECAFNGIDYGNKKMSEITFVECSFVECNFNMNDVHLTSFQNVLFEKCKLLGVNFSNCKQMLLEMKFLNSKLDYCVFQKLKMPRTEFVSCSLTDADFFQTDLKGSKVINCDLSGAIFENTILENADFSSSYNYTIDPELNYIEGAKFTLSSLPGLLSKYRIKIED
ncbi:pentapeptide repeat-containing protein [bacterium]|nr:pentapeptide repeat-containing protein [bacterium]